MRKPLTATAFHPTLPPPRFFRDLITAALVAAGLWASFPDVGFWWLTVPSLALMVAMVDRGRAGRATLLVFVVGMGFWCAHVSWVEDATHVWFTVPALALTQALWWAAWAWLVSVARIWKWTRTALGQALVFALTWVGVEQARGLWPLSGFPWAQVAYSQVEAPVGHLAPWGGEVVVSAACMLAAVLLRRAFSLAPGQDVRRWWSRLFMLITAGVMLIAPGLIPLPAGEEAGLLRVGVVQGNVEQPGNETYQIRNKVLTNHAQETMQLAAAGQDLDVVIWGENSADRDPLIDEEAADMISASAQEVAAPILVGRVSFDEDDKTRLNWAGWWYPEGSEAQAGWDDDETYAKLIPVPFGEYIPWRDSWIGALATDVARFNYDMVPGSDDPLITVTLADGRSVPVAVAICFESAYERIFADGIQGGGQIIVTPTNNYHFNTTAESTQQAQMLRFRAMEFSRSAIQASTTGVSAIIRPDGSIVSMTGRQTSEFLVAEVPLRTTQTWTAKLGQWPSRIAVGTTTVLGVLTLLAALVLPIHHRSTDERSRR